MEKVRETDKVKQERETENEKKKDRKIKSKL